MIGTAVHSRNRRITSMPSMSGSPRSTMTTSGWREPTSTRPSAPVVASNSRYPWPVSVARRKRRIWGSSSMRTTTGSGIGGHRGRRLSGQRQREKERDAALGQVLGPDAPAVRLDDALADREAETGAPAAVGLPAVKLLEDLVLLPARQPRAAVGDLRGDGAVRRGRDDSDRTLGRGVLDRVVEEVHEDLLDEHVVDRHQRQIGRDVRRDAPVRESLAEATQRRTDHLLERMPFLAELERAGLEPCHLEQVLDEAVQPFRLLAYRFQEFLLRSIVESGSFVQDRADRPGDRRERCSEVVRDRAEQGVPQALAFDPDLGLLGFGGEIGALDRERGLVAECLELVELLRSIQSVPVGRPDEIG